MKFKKWAKLLSIYTVVILPIFEILVWPIPIAVCTVLDFWWWTERDCPRHVVFHSRNKFEKLLHLLAFIIRIFQFYLSYSDFLPIYLMCRKLLLYLITLGDKHKNWHPVDEGSALRIDLHLTKYSTQNRHPCRRQEFFFGFFFSFIHICLLYSST